MTRVVFLGSPGSALPTLTRLAAGYDVALVVTQPDRPRGRSGRPRPSPVKEAALELGLDVAQPATSRELSDVMSSIGPFDLGVVVAFGMILRPEALRAPRSGVLNLHFSLLPRWRGAAPVARAIMAGDPMTGVTIMKMDEGLDTGPVLTAQAVDIGDEETAGELTERLARLGSRLIVESIDPFLAGDLEPMAQVEEGALYAAKIVGDDRVLDTDMAPAEFVNVVRGLSPSPGARLVIDGEPHKILRARPHPSRPQDGSWELTGRKPVVAVSGGGVELVEIQPPGKRVMAGEAWANGRRARSGSVG